MTHLEEPEYGSGTLSFASFNLLCLLHGVVLEAVAVVTGLDDMAMVRESIQ